MMIDSICLAVAGDNGSLIAKLLDWLDLTEPWQIALFFFGLLGQTVFFMRWIFQWISSERRGESHMPLIFWWCSLLGAMMLLIYFILRREPIGVLGQLTGWTIYARNLFLLRKHRTIRKAAGTRTTPPSADAPDIDVCPTCGRPVSSNAP